MCGYEPTWSKPFWTTTGRYLVAGRPLENVVDRPTNLRGAGQEPILFRRPCLQALQKRVPVPLAMSSFAESRIHLAPRTDRYLLGALLVTAGQSGRRVFP